VKLRRELNERLFQPRRNRILDILKGRKPREISGRDKRAINSSLKPLIIEAIREGNRTELDGLETKPFKLAAYPPSQRKNKIIQKIKGFEKNRDKKVRRLIYSLWNDQKECLYVGQTKRGLPEVVAKGDALYKQSFRLKLHLTNNKKKLDRHEGIAYHIFAPVGKPRPKFNTIHPRNAREKCPFCKIERKIRREISRSLMLVTPKRRSIR
jgi:hypothetical protein